MSGKSGCFVKCQGISLIIGIYHPFLWELLVLSLENRKQVPILTCNSSLQYQHFEDILFPISCQLGSCSPIRNIRYRHVFSLSFFISALQSVQIHTKHRNLFGNILEVVLLRRSCKRAKANSMSKIRVVPLLVLLLAIGSLGLVSFFLFILLWEYILPVFP